MHPDDERPDDGPGDSKTWTGGTQQVDATGPYLTNSPTLTPQPATLRAPGTNTGGDSSSGDWDVAPPPDIRPGQIVFENYELISPLGEGGMGQVWLVSNLKMQRKRALKLIRPEIARNDRGWKRFQREAQLMAQLDHPGAVRVYDYRRVQSMGYIEMEQVAGRSLDRILREQREKPMPLEWVVPVLDQLCAVLHEAHTHVDETTGRLKPIIHRDLKPSNLMLVDAKPPGQNLKVLDFGIAKMVDDEDTVDDQLTGQGEFLGTVAYCSPEQILSAGRANDDDGPGALDGRSDLYTVGVILYELITGRRPFLGPTNAVLAAHLRDAPPPMSEANPHLKVPPAVERVVLQCLAKKPEQRPGDALELARAFREAAALGPVTTTLPVPAARGRRPLVLAGVGLLAAVILGSTAWALLGPRKPAKIEVDTAPTKPIADVSPPKPAPREPEPVWTPEGYVAFGNDPPAVGVRREPRKLRRVSDGVTFVRLKEGVYLPEGFESEDDKQEGGWPRSLIRTRDRALAENVRPRFIRIPGKRYQRGDTRGGVPANDDDTKNPCTPHWVSVAPFYIQETEVTNAQLADYLGQFGDEARALQSWKKAYELVRDADPRLAEQHPAVCVSHAAARKVARYYQGRLPSEAEWELTARSGEDESLWSWGPKRGTRKAALFDPNKQMSSPVRAFPDDSTQQHVFDLTGNVQEWCLEKYRPYRDIIAPDNSAERPVVDQPVSTLPDAAGPGPDEPAVVRGGSFRRDADEAMAFRRWKVNASEEVEDLGFRIVIDVPQP